MYLEKENSGYNYKFVSSSQTLLSVKTEMDKQGIMIIPNVRKHDVRDHKDRKGNHEYFTILDITYTVINSSNPD